MAERRVEQAGGPPLPILYRFSGAYPDNGPMPSQVDRVTAETRCLEGKQGTSCLRHLAAWASSSQPVRYSYTMTLATLAPSGGRLAT